MILVNGQVIGVKRWISKDGTKKYQNISCSFDFCFYGNAFIEGSDVHVFWVSGAKSFEVGQAVKIGVSFEDGKMRYEVIENG